MVTSMLLKEFSLYNGDDIFLQVWGICPPLGTQGLNQELKTPGSLTNPGYAAAK